MELVAQFIFMVFKWMLNKISMGLNKVIKVLCIGVLFIVFLYLLSPILILTGIILLLKKVFSKRKAKKSGARKVLDFLGVKDSSKEKVVFSRNIHWSPLAKQMLNPDGTFKNSTNVSSN